MKKKYIAVVIGLMLTTQAAVAEFYVGGQVGGALMRGDAVHDDQSLQQTRTAHTRNMGAAFGGHVGYMYRMQSNHMFVLGEGYFVKQSGKNKTTDLTLQDTSKKVTFNVQPQYNFGAFLGLGVSLNPRFGLYGKVGFENKKISATYRFPDDTQDQTAVTKSVWAIAPGVGMFFKVNHWLMIAPEYTYVVGKKYKIASAKLTPQAVNSTATYWKNINFTPTEHRLMVKFNINF